jgi:hypothetical protein
MQIENGLLLRAFIVAEWLFRILFRFAGNVPPDKLFNPRSTEKRTA